MSVNLIDKKQAHDYEVIACSWHEAGHAICALHYCLRVAKISIITLTKEEGSTDYDVYDNFTEDPELIKQMILCELKTLYAGLIAEKLYYFEICGSKKFPMHLKEGSSSDIEAASKLIRKYNLAAPGNATANFKKQIQKEVKDLLLEHWDAVQIIAHYLYQKKNLEFKDIKRILTNKTNHNLFWKDRFNKIKKLYTEYLNKDVSADAFIRKMLAI